MKPAHRPDLLLKDLGGLLLYYPGVSLAEAAPRRLLGPLAALGGDLVRHATQPQAEAEDELRRLFGPAGPPRPTQDILREAYRAALYNELEVLRYGALTPKNIGQLCQIEGREHLDRALGRGKGVILLIGHYGANQLIMPALGHQGYPMNQLSAPPIVWAEILRETRTTPLWEKVLARRWALEQRLPVQHINVFSFLRPAFDCLRRNEILGLAFDGGGGSAWAEVQFLARRAQVSVQPAQLWKKTGAALLPATVFREAGQRRHTLSIAAPLDYQPGGDKNDELQRNMQAIVDRFTPHVAARPDHYLQFLLMRRRVRGTDQRPFFTDYPPLGPAR